MEYSKFGEKRYIKRKRKLLRRQVKEIYKNSEYRMGKTIGEGTGILTAAQIKEFTANLND